MQLKQEVWPPGSPTRYAPARLYDGYSILFPEWRSRDETYRRCELMTLTFDLEGHRDCRSYASWYFVRVPSANFVVKPTRVRHSMWPCDLDLWPWRSRRLWMMRVVVLHPSLKFVGLAIRKIWRTICVSILMALVTLIFDILTLKLVCESYLWWEPSFQIWAR